jgi:hypothetical protein
MLKLTTNNKEIEVPTNWGELSTQKYIKLTNLLSLYKNEETGEVNVDGELLFQKIAQSILNMTRDEILELDFKIIIAIKACFIFLNTPMPEPRIVKLVKYKDHIIKVKDFNNLSFGQFADIQQLMAAQKKDEIKLISKIIDVYQPKNVLKLKFKDKKVEITDEQKLNILNDIPCTDFNNLSFFLLRRMVKYMRTTRRSLNKMALRMNAGTALRAAGVIIRSFWHLLMIKLTKSKRRLT